MDISQTQTPLLQLRDIGKKYENQEVLRGIEFALKAKEIICLLGPSGCGKTTTLLIIAGILKPDSGQVWICGKKVSGEKIYVPPEKRNIGFVFQNHALFPHLSVEKNIGFGAKGHHHYKKRRIEEEIERFGMQKFAKAYPHMLSGGESQRVALARALASDPDILLLDEPFSSLDRQWRESLREETVDILRQKGSACVFVTHDPEEACFVADHIILIDKGQILQQGKPDDLYAQPTSLSATRFFGRPNLTRAVVNNGQAYCGALSIPTPDFANGVFVDIAIRPEAFRLQGRPDMPNMPSVQAHIRLYRPMGAYSLLKLEIDGLDELLTAHVFEHHGDGLSQNDIGTRHQFYLDISKIHIFKQNPSHKR